MRDAAISAALAFAAVLVLAAAFQPPAPTEATPTPITVSPAVKCGVPEPDCTKLATEFIARARSTNPGKVVASVVVMSATSFEACFTDGTCYGEAAGVGPAVPVPPPDVPEPAPATSAPEPVPETPVPAP